ncbi:MAG: radical SAM family heme chaperone HemW [Eubacterium sp.]|nr:radical SAM family heme chaperone HemW [Eubacterium sp.]
MTPNDLELYLHIPFCVRKCAYCDFLSFPSSDGDKALYVDRLTEEIRCRWEREKEPVRTATVFIGGGTPSVLPAASIRTILETVRETYGLPEGTEVSVEVNPGTVTEEKLRVWKDAGINRISFGCQSMDDEELKLLGRIHTVRDFLENYQMARKLGFEEINVDLMSALPGQSLDAWERTLRKAASLQTEHISAYSLIIEEGTPFGEKYTGRPELLPDEETDRAMYERTAEILGDCGFAQYEISNYAKPGHACRHNVGYWTGVPYQGFGLGASSYRENTRYKNTDVMREYLGFVSEGGSAGSSEFPEREKEILTEADLRAEFMILGLRLTNGVSSREFEERFGAGLDEVYGSVIRKYRSLGFLETEGDRVRLNRKGLSVSNTIMAEFLP